MGTSKLTILFEDPFWIGLYEREDDTGYAVCRIVFGGEPRDQEVYAYLLEHWRTLRFSPPRPGADRPDAPKSPKRRQREARRMTQAGGIGTKAQQALKLQQEQGKQAASPAPASSGRRRRPGSSSCGRSAERKSTEVTDLCAVFVWRPGALGSCAAGGVCYNSGVEHIAAPLRRGGLEGELRA